MIFLDSNIPMYLIGGPHAHKAEAQILLERLIAANQRLVTDAEVLQEILRRYGAIDRREAIPPAMKMTLDIVDDVFSVEQGDVTRASEIMHSPGKFSARDALHIATMERHGVDTILSFDADFDRWPGLNRIHAV